MRAERQRSGNRSGAGRKSSERERSGERAWRNTVEREVAERERSGERTKYGGAGTEREAGGRGEGSVAVSGCYMNRYER